MLFYGYERKKSLTVITHVSVNSSFPSELMKMFFLLANHRRRWVPEFVGS